MCKHPVTLATDYSTHVCTSCGLERRRPIDMRSVEYSLNQPLWEGYSRVNRFRKILKMLFFPKQWAHVPGPVFIQMKQQGKFPTVKEMCTKLKNVKARTKNYNAIHLYAIYFVENYTPMKPPLHNVQQNILADFSLLERGMLLLYPKKRFFSYRWVLIRLLEKYKLNQYIQFVKPLVSKTSSKKYEIMFDEIMIASKRVLVRDTPRDSEIQPELQQGGGSESQAFECGALRLSKSDLHSRGVGEYCQRVRNLPDNLSPLESHILGVLANRRGEAQYLRPWSPGTHECLPHRSPSDPSFSPVVLS